MEKGKEPGTAKFGNFINYYSFNPARRRIDLIPETLMSQVLSETTGDVLCLDVGCNAGELTEAMYSHLFKASDKDCENKIHMLGVDIDPLLIERCRSHSQHPEHVTYQTADVMAPSDREQVLDKFLSKHGLEKFALTTCFSVTLWIHLHHGDEGLRDFLRILCDKTKHLLIEPQPFKCYKTAVRRMKRANCDGFPQFENLKWKQNVDQEIIDFIVEKCQMKLVKVLGETEWDRKICFFSCDEG